MVNNKRPTDDLEQFFDSMFEQLDKDDDKVMNVNFNEFGKQIKVRVDDSVKKNGYDSVEEMINHKVSGANYQRPDVNDQKIDNTKDFNTRYEYFMNLLENVTYARSYRGYYLEGHQKMIQMFIEKAKFCQEDLSQLESDLVSEKRKFSRGKQDMYTRGCKDGIDYVQRALHKSKMYIMTKIKNELAHR